MKFHKFYLCHCALDNLELELTDFNDLVELRETLVLMKYESADGHILVAFRQIEVKHLIDIVNFKASRKEIVAVLEFLCYVVGGLILFQDS